MTIKSLYGPSQELHLKPQDSMTILTVSKIAVTSHNSDIPFKNHNCNLCHRQKQQGRQTIKEMLLKPEAKECHKSQNTELKI